MSPGRAISILASIYRGIGLNYFGRRRDRPWEPNKINGPIHKLAKLTRLKSPKVYQTRASPCLIALEETLLLRDSPEDYPCMVRHANSQHPWWDCALPISRDRPGRERRPSPSATALQRSDSRSRPATMLATA
jgi:hypothetical protein